MKRFILAISMFSIWLAIASTYYMCVIKGVCANEKIVEVSPTITPDPVVTKASISLIDANATSPKKDKDSLIALENKIKTIDSLKVTGLKIYDKEHLIKSYYSNFRIYQSAPRVQIPFEISEYGYLIAKHMDSVNSTLIIKGYYNKEETLEQGLQRADFIKERLTKLGIPTNLMATESELAIFEYNYKKFTGGIQFNFKKADSIIKINSVDYGLFKNEQQNTASNSSSFAEITNIKANESKPIDLEIESGIKKEPNVTTSAEAKKEVVPDKKEKILFTITERDFRKEKFKASKSFKKFFETHKAAKSIQLMGYSNASESTSDNYNKGLELANLVSGYLLTKGNYTGKTVTNALKKQQFLTNDAVREGVTLIIQ